MSTSISTNDNRISDLHKQIFAIDHERSNKRGRGRVRMLNTVRTDTLETRISLYEARGDCNASNALRSLAREIGAPIDEQLIKLQAEVKKIYFGKQPNDND